MIATSAAKPQRPAPSPALTAPREPSCSTTFHDQLKASVRKWTRLHLVGYQSGVGAELYELRDCPVCGSSLCRKFTILKKGYPRDPHRAVAA